MQSNTREKYSKFFFLNFFKNKKNKIKIKKKIKKNYFPVSELNKQKH